MVTFEQVKEFLVSWGLHFDTPDGDSSNIPYPQVYLRMFQDVGNVFVGTDAVDVGMFVGISTDTTDGETYLFYSWEELEEEWNAFLRGN